MSEKFKTPFEPSGVVEIVTVEPGLYCGKKTALVRFTENHPMGYKAGSFGRYFLDELKPLTP